MIRVPACPRKNLVGRPTGASLTLRPDRIPHPLVGESRAPDRGGGSSNATDDSIRTTSTTDRPGEPPPLIEKTATIPVTSQSARRLTADGLTFDVRSSTAPRPVGSRAYVLIHGIGTSHRYFRRLHAELARDADVHAVDLPGFGGVPKPDGNPDVETTASALASVLDRLAIGPATVVGHSMGAQWATQLGVIRPDLVDSLVLIGPVADSAHRSIVRQGLRLGRDVLRESVGANAVVFVDYLRCGQRWYAAQSRFMIGYPIEERVRQLTMPVLVLRGGDDPIATGDWCRRLAARGGDARVVVVPGHRHVVQYTAPRAVASALRAFRSGRG